MKRDSIVYMRVLSSDLVTDYKRVTFSGGIQLSVMLDKHRARTKVISAYIFIPGAAIKSTQHFLWVFNNSYFSDVTQL